MLFKKKTEVEIETSKEDEEFLEKLNMWKMRYEDLVSNRNLKKIDDARFLAEEKIISDEIAEAEKEKNLKAFDEMMGDPMSMLRDLFHEGD